MEEAPKLRPRAQAEPASQEDPIPRARAAAGYVLTRLRHLKGTFLFSLDTVSAVMYEIHTIMTFGAV